MRILAAAGVALGLCCISAADSPSNYETYGGIRIDSDPALLPRFEHALRRCVPEASSPYRGSSDPRSLQYNSILRNCLYRYSYIDRGSYAYPATEIFDNFLGR